MKELQISNYPLPAIVDDEDWDRLSHYKWYASSTTFFGISRVINKYSRSKHISLANEIFNTRNIKYDHIDRQQLNNQKDNLRPCSHVENCRNRTKTQRPKSSQYKGVTWHKRSKKWMALITVNRHGIHLGQFDNEEAAARAYDKAAVDYFKEFACLNFK